MMQQGKSKKGEMEKRWEFDWNPLDLEEQFKVFVHGGSKKSHFVSS